MHTQFVSVMVPLITGQSKSVVIQVTPYDNAICEGCREYGCVVMPSGEKCVAVECPDCALEGWFRDSYGYIIKGDISLDELIRNEAKYAMTPTLWLTMYTNGELDGNVLRREHDANDILHAMEMLMESASPPSDNEEIISPTMGSLHITSPKVTSRARRQIDTARTMMESLSLGDHAECGRSGGRDTKRLRTD